MRLALLLGLLSVLAACDGSRANLYKTHMLGIVGYNYTHRYIHTFSVGGQGGGNVGLSTPTSGGGGTVCCIGYNPRRELPIKMKVRWTFGYKRDAQGQIVVPAETHETIAELRGPIPEDPQQLEVHFMPDGSVQLRITHEYSLPMVIVERRAGQRP